MWCIVITSEWVSRKNSCGSGMFYRNHSYRILYSIHQLTGYWYSDLNNPSDESRDDLRLGSWVTVRSTVEHSLYLLLFPTYLDSLISRCLNEVQILYYNNPLFYWLFIVIAVCLPYKYIKLKNSMVSREVRREELERKRIVSEGKRGQALRVYIYKGNSTSLTTYLYFLIQE